MTENEPQPKMSFREAAIRSKLISEKKYDRVVELAGTNDEAVIVATLIKSGLVTEYQAQQLKAGKTKLTLGEYLITDWIGQGGMGHVFKAVHQRMGRECAVKVLPREKSNRESRESFMHEIRIQAGMDSPYVVRVFDAGEDGKVNFMVTEYVPGTDLRRLVKRNGPLSMGDAAHHFAGRIGSDACS